MAVQKDVRQLHAAKIVTPQNRGKTASVIVFVWTTATILAKAEAASMEINLLIVDTNSLRTQKIPVPDFQ